MAVPEPIPAAPELQGRPRRARPVPAEATSSAAATDPPAAPEGRSESSDIAPPDPPRRAGPTVPVARTSRSRKRADDSV
jgi:hypothetical protein